MEAWVLRLKDESKTRSQKGKEFYFDGYDVTSDLNEAEVFKNKEQQIEFMKNHEIITKKNYGKDAICNYGYTNMMTHFEFVEVEVEYL